MITRVHYLLLYQIVIAGDIDVVLDFLKEPEHKALYPLVEELKNMRLITLTKDENELLAIRTQLAVNYMEKFASIAKSTKRKFLESDDKYFNRVNSSINLNNL